MNRVLFVDVFILLKDRLNPFPIRIHAVDPNILHSSNFQPPPLRPLCGDDIVAGSYMARKLKKTHTYTHTVVPLYPYLFYKTTVEQ